MISIDDLKRLNDRKNIVITEHARIRLIERGIEVKDIINGISTGEIIKQYEDDTPFPSCLILGSDVNDKRLHIVVSYDGEIIHLITAYYPDPEIWVADFKVKKED